MSTIENQRKSKRWTADRDDALRVAARRHDLWSSVAEDLNGEDRKKEVTKEECQGRLWHIGLGGGGGITPQLFPDSTEERSIEDLKQLLIAREESFLSQLQLQSGKRGTRKQPKRFHFFRDRLIQLIEDLEDIDHLIACAYFHQYH